MIDSLRDRVVGSTASLFSHGPQALEHTLDHMGDPGLLGPESVSWRVIGDAAAFVGGIRALLIQTAHPEVSAGVEQHSRYRDDPLGRLSRTSVYVTETTYGSMPEVQAAVQTVRVAHKPVTGRSERDKPYSAANPQMAAWVHNVLTDSFLAAYEAFGPRRLTAAEADRFVEEQTRIGALLDAAPLPTTAKELAQWVSQHPALAPSEAHRNAVKFLRKEERVSARYVDRSIEEVDFMAAKQAPDGRILNMRAAIDDSPSAPSGVVAMYLRDIYKWWTEASLRDQRALVRRHVGRIVIHPAKHRGGNVFDPDGVEIVWKRDPPPTP